MQRSAMRLMGEPSNPYLIYCSGHSQNLTEQLASSFHIKLPDMGKLDGYILMNNSPSCGMERVKVCQADGQPHIQRGRGLFASALMQAYPMMPVEEEGRLHDARLYENFILRVYAHHNFRHEVRQDLCLHKLIAFHSSYKYVLMAHNQSYYRSLGVLLADPKGKPLKQLVERYFFDFMNALAKPASAKNHTNTLFHILGYLKKIVPSATRQNIAEIILRYRREEIPLVVPLMLLKHYIEQEGTRYVRMQRYLQPYPAELGLANRI